MRVRTAVLVAGLVAMGGGCGARNPTGELMPPEDAAEFEARYLKAFDDDYTRQPVKLSGRAPHDVVDQRLFAARLGHADVVALCSVVQVWGRGRFQGRQEQFLDIVIGDILLGSLMKGTVDDQLLLVSGEDDLPGKLQNDQLILFLKWAPGEAPPYHHHLMPADKETLSYIGAMIDHAKREGVLDESGDRSKRRKRPRGKKARGQAEADAAVSTDDELPH